MGRAVDDAPTLGVTIATPAPLLTPQPSKWGLYLRALTRDPYALAAAIFLAVLIFAAAFAPWITPYDPERDTRQQLLASAIAREW